MEHELRELTTEEADSVSGGALDQDLDSIVAQFSSCTSCPNGSNF